MLLRSYLSTCCIDHGDLYDSLFYGFQCQKRKEKAEGFTEARIF